MSLLPLVNCCKCNNAEGSCCFAGIDPETNICIQTCVDTLAYYCRDDTIYGKRWFRAGVFCSDLEEAQGCGVGRCCAQQQVNDQYVKWISCTDGITFCQCHDLGVAYEAANPPGNPNAPSGVFFKWYQPDGLTCATDPGNSGTGCSPELGQCCYTLVESGAPQDCETICDDEVERYECTALGGTFKLGAECTNESCKGVCCVTTAENADPALSERFVSCSENVTECECISDNLSVDLKVHFYMGNDRKCYDADIQCPCTCSVPGYSILPGLLTTTRVYYKRACNYQAGCSLTFTTVTTNELSHYFAVDYAGVSLNGPNDISDWTAYIASLGPIYSYVTYCELDPTRIADQLTVTYSFTTGNIVHPSSKCTRTAVAQPSMTYTTSCTPAADASNAGCPTEYRCNFYPANGTVTTAQSVMPQYCSTCQLTDCFHESGDCDNCP